MKKVFKHLIVVSFDSLSSFDVERMSTLPNFKKLMSGSFFCDNVRSVYPSLTYPAHVSIVTGKTPAEHGVTANTLKQYHLKSPDWFWHRSFIKGETLFDLAKKQGKTVSAILWPVTAKADIKYNMPEIFANRKGQNQILVSLRNGSPLFQMRMALKYGKLRNGIRQPELDRFVQAVFLDTVKTYRPNLTLVHFTDVDTHRHLHGVHSEEAGAAIKRLDEKLGELFGLLASENLIEDTALLVLGDHGAMDTTHCIRLNPVLSREFFLKIRNDGTLEDYEFVVKSCDGSAYVYENPRRDRIKERVEKLRTLLDRYVERGILEKIYDKKEATEMGADPECLFMLEAAKGYYFMDGFTGPELEETTGKAGYDNHYLMATHGYDPKREDYGTIFALCTDLRPLIYESKKTSEPEMPETLKAFVKDGKLEGLCLTDEYEVLKELLGLIEETGGLREITE